MPASEITVDRGVIRHRTSGRQSPFGEFAEAAAKLTQPDNVPLKDPANFKLIGRDGVVKKLDAPAKTNGTAKFTIDVRESGYAGRSWWRIHRASAARSRASTTARRARFPAWST